MPLLGTRGREVLVVKRTGFDPRSQFLCRHFLVVPHFTARLRRRSDRETASRRPNKGRRNASIGSCPCNALGREGTVSLRTAVAEELPNISHFRDHVEI